MWKDYYLHFTDKAAFEGCREALEAAEAAIDDIGVLYRDDTGAESPGYHVNMRLPEWVAVPAGAAGYVIARPVRLKRVFMADV